jgi:glucose/arabinose dehydrogenase
MRRRPAIALIAASLLALLLAACSSDDKGKAQPSTTTTTTTSSTSGSTTSTVPPLGDYANAKVKLTPVAKVAQVTAFAIRTGDPGFYVTEQEGRVRAIRDGKLVDSPVLDLTDRVASGGERGLLGLTFSPDGSKLYVDYTNKDGDTRVDEYAMSANGTADKASRRELLAIDQPQPNHNGGNVVMGPDKMLYVGMGDGGAAGDQGAGHASGGNGQSLDTLLGKLLRIDPTPSGGKPYTIPPDNPYASGGGRPEIFAYGLRNPWKYSFDRATGDLWIADVGQNQWEEVDRVPAPIKPPLNFGWNVFEATHRFRDGDAPGAIMPVYEYSHGDGCSISGGYVYRGTKIPALQGAFLFSDACSSSIRAVGVKPDGTAAPAAKLGVQSNAVVGFGQDQQGELYVLSQSAGVLKIEPSS